PNSKDFLFRKSLVYGDAKQFKTAYEISGDLFREYPYNDRYRNAYVQQRIGAGRQFREEDKNDSALVEFSEAMLVSPRDTVPLYYAINLLYQMEEYDSAIVLLNKGRKLYPTNHFFLFRKAETLEKM